MSVTQSTWLLLMPLLLLSACDLLSSSPPEESGSWRAFGLDGLWVHEVDIRKGAIYAGTDDGMYRLELGGGGSWKPIGLQGKRVVDFTWLADESLLAALRLGDVRGEGPSLYKRSSPEEDWHPFQNNYGGPDGYNWIEALASMPGARDTLFARGSANVSKSTDGGQSWISVHRDWSAFGGLAPLLYFDPNKEHVIWAGGEAAIARPYLLKSVDYGKTWDHIRLDGGGDNAAYSLVVREGNSDEVLVGMEGQVQYSEDGGATWETVFEPESYAYIKTMQAPSPQNDALIYASGSERSGQTAGKLALYVSRDFGQTWSSVSYDDGPERLSVWDMAIIYEGGHALIYLATTEGMFLYESALDE